MTIEMVLKGKIQVLYEDEHMAVLDKPAGLLTIPAPGKAKRSVNEILDAALKSAGIEFKLHPCHRLDEETSGVLLYAKGKAAQKTLMDLFHKHLVKKTYTAVVQGQIEKDEGSFTRSLDGKPARTEYCVRERREGFTVADVRLKTGRKNQIRLHFKAAGHPLIGETRFAFRKDSAVKAKRVMLHARCLEFQDPWTGALIRVEAKYPEDMKKFLKA